MSAVLSRVPGTYIYKYNEALLWPCEFQHMAEKKYKLDWLRKVHLQREDCVDHELITWSFPKRGCQLEIRN